MALNRGQSITFTDLQALASAANTALSPPTPYAFNPLVDSTIIRLPTDFTFTPNYGAVGTGTGPYPDSTKVTVQIYGYKTIGGVKNYTLNPVTKAFYSTPGAGSFTLTWNWTPVTGPTAPDGYILAAPIPSQNAGTIEVVYAWIDALAVNTWTQTDSGYSGWNSDQSLIPGYNATIGGVDLPCGHGIWLKQLGIMRADILYHTDILTANYGSIAGLVSLIYGTSGYGSVSTLGTQGLQSGSWCVCIGPVLSASISKANIYGLITDHVAVSQMQTQLYRNISFLFRNQDAPSGVNITAQNQLLSFEVGSNPATATTATYQLSLVSCSTGTIIVQSAGGGTVYQNISVTAGTVYDLSFTITGTFSVGAILPINLDFLFTTPASAIADATTGIELTNDVQSCAVTDSYFEVQFNLCIRNGGGTVTGTRQCATCGQLVLTENNGTVGLWVAKTVPTMGVMGFVDQDLPNYLIGPQAALQPLGSGRNIAFNGSLQFMPLINNRGALWPVFKDSDFTPDSVFGRPFTGSKAWRGSIFTPYIRSELFNTTVPGPSFTQVGSFFVTNGFDTDVQVVSSNATLYVKLNAPPTVGDFDATAPAGSWISCATSVPGFSAGGQLFFAVNNPFSTTLQNTAHLVDYVISSAAPNGTFFATSINNPGIPADEPKSYSLRVPNVESVYSTPLLGYSVYSITVSRLPIDNGHGVLLAPSTGTSALAVSIGTMNGFGFSAAGTFTPLASLTIPAGQSFITQDVFLPVLSGTPLAYQCAETVVVRPIVNFQPLMYSAYNATGGTGGNFGIFSGSPWYSTAQMPTPMLYFPENAFVSADGFILPLTIEIYNDLLNLLNLM